MNPIQGRVSKIKIREISCNNVFSHTNSICEGVQVFCRVGHVVRKNTSTYKLSVSVYGTTKSIMLYKGREMCISHRPRYVTFMCVIFLSLNRSYYTFVNNSRPRNEETEEDIFQRIHQKSILHEDIHIKVSQAGT